MKKVLVSFVTLVTLLFLMTLAQAAHKSEDLTVRFDENRLIVGSTQMEEASIYSLQGKLLQTEKGNLATFELEQGTYRLFAKVNGSTLTRRIEIR